MSDKSLTKDREILTGIVKMLEAQTDRLDTFENRISSFEARSSEQIGDIEQRMTKTELTVEDQVYITSRQAKQLNKAAKTRVVELLKDDAEYKTKSRKYFSWLWDEVQSKFGVAGYREIPRKYFAAAMKVICEWTPIRLAAK